MDSDMDEDAREDVIVISDGENKEKCDVEEDSGSGSSGSEREPNPSKSEAGNDAQKSNITEMVSIMYRNYCVCAYVCFCTPKY